MKIRGTIFSDLDLNKCYQGHNIDQYSKDFNHRLGTLSNANAEDIITFKLYNSKSTS